MERKNRQGKSSAASTPGSGPKKPAGLRRAGTGRSTSRTIKPSENRDGQEEEKPYRGRTTKESTFSSEKPRERKSPSARPERESRISADRPGERKSTSSRPQRDSSRTGTHRDFKPRLASDSDFEGETPKKEGYPRKSGFKPSDSRAGKPSTFKPGKGGGGFKKDFKSGKPAPKFASGKGASSQSSGEGLIRLNKYIANSGVCSRREADELILAGIVTVNGIVVTELGTKISTDDKVQYDNQTIRNEKHVYVLLNKPKGYITTTDDPFDRKTVMSLVADACKERIYPAGRLDRNTTGLLLLTNDGDMAKKLTHPKHKVKKVYQVELDKALTKNDMLKIADGVELEDGLALIDEIAYISGSSNKKEIGVELHSGKNRIVRRIFEATGYEVVKLDRVIFAGLTKKDLPRGKWRLLTEQEINYLKMLR